MWAQHPNVEVLSLCFTLKNLKLNKLNVGSTSQC